MDAVIAYFPAIMRGTWITIAVALCSVVLAVLLGLLGAWGKIATSRVANAVAGAYTTVIRGVPDLVLMLLLFYGGQQLLNDLGIATGWWGYVEINHFTAGVFTIGFIYGAYMTETFRGAYLSIPRGQIEAGIACGMSGALVFRRVIWPQLVRYALPGLRKQLARAPENDRPGLRARVARIGLGVVYRRTLDPTAFHVFLCDPS